MDEKLYQLNEDELTWIRLATNFPAVEIPYNIFAKHTRPVNAVSHILILSLDITEKQMQDPKGCMIESIITLLPQIAVNINQVAVEWYQIEISVGIRSMDNLETWRKQLISGLCTVICWYGYHISFLSPYGSFKIRWLFGPYPYVKEGNS